MGSKQFKIHFQHSQSGFDQLILSLLVFFLQFIYVITEFFAKCLISRVWKLETLKLFKIVCLLFFLYDIACVSWGITFQDKWRMVNCLLHFFFFNSNSVQAPLFLSCCLLISFGSCGSVCLISEQQNQPSVKLLFSFD